MRVMEAQVHPNRSPENGEVESMLPFVKSRSSSS